MLCSVSDLGEHAIIDRIRRRAGDTVDRVLVGIGDDAAVYEAERNAAEVITTDACVEGVHFDRAFVPPAAIGHRALAVNLSDLAAMGAVPRLATLSLILPDGWPVADLDACLDGFMALAERTGVTLVGGNVTRSPSLLAIDVTAVGHVHRRRILTRAGARPGDHVFVSGTLGGPRAGLAICREGAAETAQAASEAVARYLLPEPRLALGRALGRTRAASAAVDLSDGLADGAQQIARASGVGVLLEAEALPVAPDVRAWYTSRGLDAGREALVGGDDYELLFTVSPRALGRLRHLARGLSPDVTRIGIVTREPGVRLRRGDGSEMPVEGGFEHFKRA